jgi:hypothetical protein
MAPACTTGCERLPSREDFPNMHEYAILVDMLTKISELQYPSFA